MKDALICVFRNFYYKWEI